MHVIAGFAFLTLFSLISLPVVHGEVRDYGSEEIFGFKSGRSAPLTLLDLSTGAACLDGSPYGFYFIPSTTNSTKWTIYIQGGGWCYNETLCYERSKTRLGSSKFFANTSSCGCMNSDGTSDCNCIYMPYGDGASFSGYRAHPVEVPGSGGKLYFRGIQNLDATVEYALTNLGLGEATELVVTGSSAGGLSTYLHTDRIVAMVQTRASRLELTRAAPVVGYFLDHDNYNYDSYNYTTWMKYIYGMQNLTTGALLPSCLKSFPSEPHYCFMSPHMEKFIKTPFFVFNSKYDEWQMVNILQAPCYKNHQNACTDSEQKAVMQYGKDFMTQFDSVESDKGHGGFITSCVCHGCSWDSLTKSEASQETAMDAYLAWINGKTTGAGSFHIDQRGPNGDGTIKLSSCKPFP